MFFLFFLGQLVKRFRTLKHKSNVNLVHVPKNSLNSNILEKFKYFFIDFIAIFPSIFIKVEIHGFYNFAKRKCNK